MGQKIIEKEEERVKRNIRGKEERYEQKWKNTRTQKITNKRGIKIIEKGKQTVSSLGMLKC